MQYCGVQGAVLDFGLSVSRFNPREQEDGVPVSPQLGRR